MKVPPTYTSPEFGREALAVTPPPPPDRDGGCVLYALLARLYVIRPLTGAPLMVPVTLPPAKSVSWYTARARNVELGEISGPRPVTALLLYLMSMNTRFSMVEPFDAVAEKCPPRIVLSRPLLVSKRPVTTPETTPPDRVSRLVTLPPDDDDATALGWIMTGNWPMVVPLSVAAPLLPAVADVRDPPYSASAPPTLRSELSKTPSTISTDLRFLNQFP